MGDSDYKIMSKVTVLNGLLHCAALFRKEGNMKRGVKVMLAILSFVFIGLFSPAFSLGDPRTIRKGEKEVAPQADIKNKPISGEKSMRSRIIKMEPLMSESEKATLYKKGRTIEEKKEPQRIGITMELDWGTIYYDRGDNVFKENAQSDQNAYMAPSISYAFPHTGLWIRYGNVYQWSGRNLADNVDAGKGHEQNIGLGYSYLFSPKMYLDAKLAAFFFPFANEEEAGVDVPCYLEPSLNLAVNSLVELSLFLAYYSGIQKNISDTHYLYIRPAIRRGWRINKMAEFALGIGAGVKLLNEGAFDADNVIDLDLLCEVPLTLAPQLSLTPSLHAAWSNYKELDISDETMVWASLNMKIVL